MRGYVTLKKKKKKKNICKDSYIFENPFPTGQEDVISKIDAWKTASRQCDIKGKVPDVGRSVDKFVSDNLHAS